MTQVYGGDPVIGVDEPTKTRLLEPATVHRPTREPQYFQSGFPETVTPRAGASLVSRF